MSVLNYPGLEKLWEHITSKFASVNTVNGIQGSLTNLTDNFNNLDVWFTLENDLPPKIFNGLASSVKIVDKSTSSTVTGEIIIQGTTDNTLTHFGSNAQITNSASSTDGYTQLTLGNSKISTATNSAKGQIKLYGTGAGSVTITHSGTSSTNSYVSFPEGGSSSSPLKLATTQDVNGVSTAIGTLEETISTQNTSINNIINNYATKENLNTEISNLLGGATAAELNTLKELSDALNDDEDFATTVLGNITDIEADIESLGTAISGKAPTDHSSTATTYGVASASKYGHVKIGSNISVSSGTISVPIMTAATASAAGKVGLVPAPVAGNQSKFLRGDGTWATPSNTKVNTTLATTTKAYLLGTSTTPTDTATGVTSVADTGVYLTTTAGQLAVKNLLITDTGANQHIKFSREGFNYISAPLEGAAIAFSFGSEDLSQNTCTLCMKDKEIYPGVSNTTNLGSSTLKWANVYATTFTGDLSGNASTATALTTSAGSSSRAIYFSGGKPVQVDNIIIGSQSDNTERSIEVRRKNSSDDSYGRLHFSLSNTGSTAFIDYLHYDASGNSQENLLGISVTSFYPNATESINLGLSSKKWKTVYAQTFDGTATKASSDGDGNTISSTYLKLAGGTMTGDLKIGTTSSATGYYLRMQRAVGDTYYVSRFYTNGDTGAASIQTMKASTTVNYMYLREDETVFKQPVTLASGGTGATTRTGAWDNIVAGAGIFSGTPVIANASYYGSLWFKATKIASGGENRNAVIYAWTGSSTATDLSYTCFSFRQYSATANATTMSSVYDEFFLPKTEQGLSTGGTYSILTTKATVTIAQGGTGATDAASARSKLGITPANIGALSTSGGTLSGNVDVQRTFNEKQQVARMGVSQATGYAYLSHRTDGVEDNYISLGATETKILVPLGVSSGGTGASDAATARSKLGITPANIGAAPTSHASTATTYGAASASNYGHAMASSTTPKANGTAAVGSETAKFARGDHVHPLQTSVSGSSGSCTGNAATATALTSSAGSSSKPVYFSSGKPVAISNLTLGDSADNAYKGLTIARKGSSDASNGKLHAWINSAGTAAGLEFVHYDTSGTQDGTTTLYINSGAVFPDSNNTKNLGSSSYKWATVYATSFNGSGASLTSLNASNISSGTLALARGGTGATSAAGARTNLGICGAITHGTGDPSGGSDGDIYFKHA